MPGVLFLPDQFYDYRIWADLPASLGADCDAVCYDVHASMPWEEPDSRAFLGAVRRLVPDPARTAVAAAGQAAGLAVQAARKAVRVGQGAQVGPVRREDQVARARRPTRRISSTRSSATS